MFCNFFVKLMNASSKNKNEKLGHHYLSFYVFFFSPKKTKSSIFFSVVSLKSFSVKLIHLISRVFLPPGISFIFSSSLIFYMISLKKKHVKHSATEIFFHSSTRLTFFLRSNNNFFIVYFLFLNIFSMKRGPKIYSILG